MGRQIVEERQVDEPDIGEAGKGVRRGLHFVLGAQVNDQSQAFIVQAGDLGRGDAVQAVRTQKAPPSGGAAGRGGVAAQITDVEGALNG